jgi:hypothetical protein
MPAMSCSQVTSASVATGYKEIGEDECSGPQRVDVIGSVSDGHFSLS